MLIKLKLFLLVTYNYNKVMHKIIIILIICNFGHCESNYRSSEALSSNTASFAASPKSS